MVFQLLKNVPKMFEEWSTIDLSCKYFPKYSVSQCAISSYLDMLFHSPLLITSEEKMSFAGKGKGKFHVVKDVYISTTREEEVSLAQLELCVEDPLLQI